VIVGIMRVKNEERWITRSIDSIQPICHRIIILDDHSTDDTARIAQNKGVEVYDSPFSGLDEVRDKNFLLERTLEADWVLCIDGDEMLARESVLLLRDLMQSDAQCISMRIPYLWDSEDQIRIDGVYGEFRRHSAFRPGRHRYQSTSANGFHCGNVPIGARTNTITRDDIKLLHFGYMDARDRARKYAWYNAVDPANEREDRYRHIAAGLSMAHGDLLRMQTRMRREAGLPQLTAREMIPRAPLACESTAHAGPLKLELLTTDNVASSR